MKRILLTLALAAALTVPAFAGGIPEPGLVMYGVVRNTANGDAPVTTGTLTWTITPPSGSSVIVSTALTDISGQYSYALRVPFESVVGSATLSPNTLQLKSASTSYSRTNITFTLGANSYPVSIAPPSLGNFTFTTSDRGRMEEVNLTVYAPGVGNIPVRPSFASVPHLANGQFQMTVNGIVGRSYTLFASTDLVNWLPLAAFVCTNTPVVIYDQSAANFSRRFYRLGP